MKKLQCKSLPGSFRVVNTLFLGGQHMNLRLNINPRNTRDNWLITHTNCLAPVLMSTANLSIVLIKSTVDVIQKKRFWYVEGESPSIHDGANSWHNLQIVHR